VEKLQDYWTQQEEIRRSDGEELADKRQRVCRKTWHNQWEKARIYNGLWRRIDFDEFT
jgi:hypothetical protein